MKTGIKPVIIFCAVLYAIFNIYKSINYYKNKDYPYDARNIHIAGKLWLKKQNPYNDSLIKTQWQTIAINSKFTSTKSPGFPQCGMIYPFWSFPMLVLYFASNWATSRVIIWSLSILFLFAIIYFAIRICIDSGYLWWQVLLLILCFKSTFTALALGQPMLMSIAAIMAMWYFYKANRNLLAGVLLGIAYSKITLCVPFVIFFAVNRNWKMLVVSSIFPILCSMVFYTISYDFYISEMLINIKQQMHINYAGHNISGINTNLTELGILFNYFFKASYNIIEKTNIFFLLLGYLILTFFYKKQIMDAPKYLALLILCNFMFSYHLIYDCILLLLLLPSIKNRYMALLLALPLFLPINGIFKNVYWLHFHLPVVIAVLFVYLLIEKPLLEKVLMPKKT